ncbi:MAG: nucleoside monophosphate kinase [Candidatus Aenigmarchaeota archaeon]|nr:nucleoside monophosphate kinase [Candidatus Aenigmarchaeota archaeon]
MIVLIIGAPASGKGTQAEMIAKKYNLKHVSTGEIFRNIKDEEIVKHLATGKLLPDELVTKAVEGEIEGIDNYLLDGYPRTLAQAEMYDTILSKGNKQLDFVIYLKTGEEAIIKRITNRRVCSECKKNYNLITNPPPKEGKCDCGGDLTQRDDDTEETIKNRLRIFREQTEPLLEHYKGKVIVVNGEQSIDGVFEDVCKEIKS